MNEEHFGSLFVLALRLFIARSLYAAVDEVGSGTCRFESTLMKTGK